MQINFLESTLSGPKFGTNNTLEQKSFSKHLIDFRIGGFKKSRGVDIGIAAAKAGHCPRHKWKRKATDSKKPTTKEETVHPKAR